jgi:HEAT repeat protein
MDADKLIGLVKALHKGDRRATIALCKYAERHPWEARYLVSSLGAALSNVETRDSAAFALAAIGPSAATAVPELIKALKYDPENYLATPFAFALGRIGPAASRAVPALIEALEVQDSNVDSHVAEALGRIGSAAAIAIPSLRVLAIESPDSNTREAASLAIKQISEA